MSDDPASETAGDSPQNWDAIWQCFDQALEQAPAQRMAWLNAQALPAAVKQQVGELLHAHEAAERDEQRQAAAADDPLLAPGTRLGTWRIVQLIGRGGMGEVYEVRRDDGSYDQRAALKLLARIDSRDDHRRFERERDILARLEHPGIARLLDGGVHAQRPYAVIEYVEGVPLTAYAAALDLRARARLLLMVCEAVAAAHRSFVVHRDLKPGNVLVTADGHTKLLDFGIAKLTGDSDARTDLTQVLALSPDYCAPEQLENGAITTATDVYALGVMLFELLTDNRPWPGTGSAMTRAMERLQQQDAPPPSRVAPASRRRTLRGDLDAIVLKALRPDAQARYATVEALAADLQRYLDGAPVQARGRARGYIISRTLKRYRWWVAAATAIVASLTLGLAGVAWQARQARIERDIALAEADRTDAVRQYLVYLFRAAGERADRNGGDQPVTAKSVLDDAAERLQSEYAEAPDRAAQMMQALGELYFLMNDYEGGMPLLQRLLEAPPPGADADTLARARFDLAQMTYRSGDAEAAVPLLDDAQRYWNARPTHYRAELASSRQLQAQLQRAAGDLPGAIETLESATAQIVEVFGPDHLDSGIHFNNLGLLYFYAGRLAEADEQFARAWQIWEARHSTRSGDALNTLNNWAAVAMRLGALDAAESRYRQALDLRRALFAPSAALAALISNYGKLMLAKDDPAAAEPLLREAVDLAGQYAGEHSPHLIAAMSGLADALARQGQLDAAEAILDDAAQRATMAGAPGQLLGLMLEMTRARVDLGRGQHAEAAARLDRTEAGFTALGPVGQVYAQQVQALRQTLGL